MRWVSKGPAFFTASGGFKRRPWFTREEELGCERFCRRKLNKRAGQQKRARPASLWDATRATTAAIPTPSESFLLAVCCVLRRLPPQLPWGPSVAAAGVPGEGT